jgi:hypothetical protein
MRHLSLVLPAAFRTRVFCLGLFCVSQFLGGGVGISKWYRPRFVNPMFYRLALAMHLGPGGSVCHPQLSRDELSKKTRLAPRAFWNAKMIMHDVG